jgi:hypothetical protein
MGVKLAHRAAVVAPVAVGAFKYNTAFLQQSRQHQIDAKGVAAHIPYAEGKILEIHEHGYEWFI